MRYNKNNTIEQLVITVLFSSIITIWHVLFFNVRVNSRMVLQPWLLQNGFVPYVNIGDEHAPLLPYILSWISKIFNGDHLFSARLLHACLIWLTIAICIWFLFGKAGRWAAIAGGAYFFAMSNSFGFWAMWYDLAVAPVFLIAYLIIINKRISFNRQVFFIGLLVGFGFLIKQHTAILLILVPIAILVQYFKNRQLPTLKLLALCVVGFLIPISIFLLYYASLTDDWYAIGYWLILFNIFGTYSDLGAKLPSIQIVRGLIPAFFMIIPFVSSTIGIVRMKGMNQEFAYRGWLLLMLALSALMLYPRYSTMHWATMLPFLAIGSGIASAELLFLPSGNRVQKYRQWGVYIAIVCVLWFGRGMLTYIEVYQNRDSRILIEYDSLPELADDIKNKSELGNIVLFPDDEGVGNLYYLLNKLPPPFWVMNYPWFRNDYVVNRWLDEMVATQPDQVIYFPSRGAHLYPEMESYISKNYATIHVLEWDNQTVEIKERK